MLQVLLTKAEDDKTVAISFDELNTIMQSMGNQQFDYDVFKAAHDADPRVKGITKNFDKDKVELVSNNDFEAPAGSNDDPKADVSAMAKRATNVGDKL